ncbi:haloacid dehalogenase [Rhodobacterales bacterium 52_120_T64]|nr:haloacid dehalogenase [Rhodobacterales bacterium 52_120_T64]
MNLKLVIFDCDGVLVDTEVLFNQALVEDLAAHGLSLTLDQCMGLFVGGTMSGVKSKAEQLGAMLPDTWVEDFYIKVYKLLGERTESIAGIEGALDAIERSGIPYCVASNGRIAKMEITLGRTGMLERFKDVMFSAQALGTAKPAPELFLAAARNFGVSPDECVVIEDSPTGVLAAKHAGMKCYGYAPHDDGQALAAEQAIIFKDMSELPVLLGL